MSCYGYVIAVVTDNGDKYYAKDERSLATREIKVTREYWSNLLTRAVIFPDEVAARDILDSKAFIEEVIPKATLGVFIDPAHEPDVSDETDLEVNIMAIMLEHVRSRTYKAKIKNNKDKK